MSFLPLALDGLNQTGSHAAEVSLTGFANEDYTSWCHGEEPDSVVLCNENGPGSQSFTIDPGAIAYAPDADYYAVRLLLKGPDLIGGHSECVQIGIDWLCRGHNPAAYDGTVSGGPYVTFGGVSLAPTFSESATGEELELAVFHCQVNWPDVYAPAAWLVNEDPVWPSPDTNGNTFGQCLFTGAQLAAIDPITVTINHYNHFQFQPGRFAIAILEYEIGETLPAGVPSQYVVGYA